MIDTDTLQEELRDAIRYAITEDMIHSGKKNFSLNDKIKFLECIVQNMFYTNVLNHYRIQIILKKLYNTLSNSLLKENKNQASNEISKCLQLEKIYFKQDILDNKDLDDKYYVELLNLVTECLENKKESKDIIKRLMEIYPVDDKLKEKLEAYDIDIYKTFKDNISQ